MRILIATFAGNIQVIVANERKFPSDAIILLVNAREESGLNENLQQAIEKIQEYYSFYKIAPEVKYIPSDIGYSGMVSKIAKVILSLPSTYSLLLNAVDGSQDLVLALISAGLYIRFDYGREINFSLFSGDQNGNIDLKNVFTFNPLPLRIPDLSDKTLLEEIQKGGTFQEYSEKLSLSKGTISQRVRTLSDYGFIEIEGRDRSLTPEGSMIVEIHKAASNIALKTEFDLSSLKRFIESCKRPGGYSHSPSSTSIDILNTYGAISCLTLLGDDFEDKLDIEFKINMKNRYLRVKQANRRLRANSRTLHRIVAIGYILNTLSKLSKNAVRDFISQLYDKKIKGYTFQISSGDPSIKRTWEVVQVAKMLNIEDIPDPSEFLGQCIVIGGGFKYEPSGTEARIPATYNGLSLAKILNYPLSEEFIKQTVDFIKSRWNGRFFISKDGTIFNIWTNHDAILSLKLLGEEISPYKEQILRNVQKCQDPSGGFKDFINAPQRKVSCTHSNGALGLISMLDSQTTRGIQIDPLFDRVNR